MKLVETKLYGTVYLEVYKRKLIKLIHKYENTDSMKSLLDIFDFDDIVGSVGSLYLSGKFICVQTNTRPGVILRYLQYGGQNIKALYLLSLAGQGIGGII